MPCGQIHLQGVKMPRLITDDTGTYMEIRWYVEDVKEERPDLTDEQCITVLQALVNNHDANFGTNWNSIHYTANFIYGEAKNDK